jgi:hypothetical protein
VATSSIEQLLTVVTRWTESRDDVLGLALVGSQAQGTASEDLDVDFVLLIIEPEDFRVDDTWLQEVQWIFLGLSVAAWRDVIYGAVWSRHVVLSDGCEVEFSFGAPSWANTTPVDQGTLSVISKGWRILLDRQGLLTSLAAHAA